MTSINEKFVDAFLKALPDGMDESEFSVTRTLGMAIGKALEDVLPKPEEHFHLMPNHVVHKSGEVFTIAPERTEIGGQPRMPVISRTTTDPNNQG